MALVRKVEPITVQAGVPPSSFTYFNPYMPASRREPDTIAATVSSR